MRLRLITPMLSIFALCACGVQFGKLTPDQIMVIGGTKPLPQAQSITVDAFSQQDASGMSLLWKGWITSVDGKPLSSKQIIIQLQPGTHTFTYNCWYSGMHVFGPTGIYHGFGGNKPVQFTFSKQAIGSTYYMHIAQIPPPFATVGRPSCTIRGLTTSNPTLNLNPEVHYGSPIAVAPGF